MTAAHHPAAALDEGTAARPATGPGSRVRSSRWRIRRALEERRRAHRSEEGFTLAEVLVAMTVLTVVITMSTATISFFYGQQNKIQRSYAGFSQVLPAATTLQNFFRSMVEPAPNAVVNGALVPVPPFQTDGAGNYLLSPNSATFTTNRNDPNGPWLVTIATTPNSAPYPPGTGPGTSTVTMKEEPPVAGTCPDVSSGTGCSWDASKAKTVFSIDDVTNGSTSSTSPILQYTYGTNASPTPYSTTAGSPWMTAFGAGSCKTTTDCPPSQITQVQIDLRVQEIHGLPAAYSTSVRPIAIAYSPIVG